MLRQELPGACQGAAEGYRGSGACPASPACWSFKPSSLRIPYSILINPMCQQVPSKPVLFNKPASAAVAVRAQHDTLQVRLPKNRGECVKPSRPQLPCHILSGCAGVINYETEIILRVKGDSFDAVSLGLDLTLRCGLLTDATSSMPYGPAL